jgi:hypothetical protein
MKALVARYDAAVVEEQELSPEARIVANVGKMDAKKHLAAAVNTAMSTNINQVSRGVVGASEGRGARGSMRRPTSRALGSAVPGAICRPLLFTTTPAGHGYHAGLHHLLRSTAACGPAA